MLIDERSGSCEFLDLAALAGRCEPCRLDFEVDGKVVPCGDVMITGNGPDGGSLSIGIEVKSITDALTSISTGRLGATQLPRMIKCGAYDHVVLLIYGGYRPGPPPSFPLQIMRRRKGKIGWMTYRVGKNPVPWSYLEGWQLTAWLKAGVVTKHVWEMGDAAAWLGTLDRWAEKRWDAHKALSVFDRSRELSAPPDADPVESQIAKTAASLPGVDWVRGWAAARYFDSVAQMMDAGVQEWMEIRGVGPVIAQSAVEIIRRRKDGNR